MNSTFSIADVRVFSRDSGISRVVVLKDQDHLLRRFGQLEVRRLAAGEQTPFTYRDQADEFWYVLEGNLSVTLVDKRVESPSEGKRMEIELSGDEESVLLVPFGVAYSLEGQTNAVLIRVATHADGTHPKDSETAYDE